MNINQTHIKPIEIEKEQCYDMVMDFFGKKIDQKYFDLYYNKVHDQYVLIVEDSTYKSTLFQELMLSFTLSPITIPLMIVPKSDIGYWDIYEKIDKPPKSKWKFVPSAGHYIGSNFQLILPINLTFKRYVYEPHKHYYIGLVIEFLCFYVEVGWEK